MTFRNIDIRTLALSSVSAIALIVLSGCGGGGGGASSMTPSGGSGTYVPVTPTPSQVASYRTAEYNYMGVLDQIHAAEAYATGWTGSGQIVGAVDFNFNFASSDIDYSSWSLGPNATAVAYYTAQTGSAPTSDPHGNAVAAVAAALKNNSGIQGIAYNAQVLAVDYFSDVNETTQVSGGTVYHISDPFTYITSHGARIINISYGYDDSDSSGGGGGPLPANVYVTVSPGITVANGALLVAAAGNYYTSSPSTAVNPMTSDLDILDYLSTNGILDSGNGAFIIVGSVDSTNTISSFSNRAGTAANYFMVAPGENLTVPWATFIGGYAVASGTSFAAPLVAGTAALILQHWPYLTMRQVMNILFESATDLGAPGVDPIYGHGLLNAYRAVQALGVSSVVLPASASVTPAGSAGMVVGQSFGDVRELKAALSHVMVLDSFGRDFYVDMSNKFALASAGPNLRQLMDNRLGWRGGDAMIDGQTKISFSISEDHISAMGLRDLQQTETRHDRQVVFQFTGADGDMKWTAGTGLGLGDAMAGFTGTRFAQSTLTEAFLPVTARQTGSFAALGMSLDSGTSLSFGMASAANPGAEHNALPALREDMPANAAMANLDVNAGDGLRFDIGAGGLFEKNAILGTRGVGGLQLTDNSTTGWITAAAEMELDPHLSLRGAFTFASTDAGKINSSLISSIGTIQSTSFSVGLAGEKLFRADDAYSFTVHQPMRTESAPVTLAYATTVDRQTGVPIQGVTQTTLAPSGREIALETAYRVSLEGWSTEANLAYMLDAGHESGHDAAAAMLWLSRQF